MCEREMTLEEWCGKLPNFHLVNKELEQLQSRIQELEADLEEAEEAVIRAIDSREYEREQKEAAEARLKEAQERNDKDYERILYLEQHEYSARQKAEAAEDLNKKYFKIATDTQDYLDEITNQINIMFNAGAIRDCSLGRGLRNMIDKK